MEPLQQHIHVNVKAAVRVAVQLSALLRHGVQQTVAVAFTQAVRCIIAKRVMGFYTAIKIHVMP